jgi:hypothetical protein
LLRFVLVSFETIFFGCFASIPKLRVSMFQLNRNKQKTNQNSLIESIIWYFSENLGLFWFVSKQFCLFHSFRYRFETPKQTKIFCFWFHGTNRNATKTFLVSVCFSLFRFELKFFFFFVSRTPYTRATDPWSIR